MNAFPILKNVTSSPSLQPLSEIIKEGRMLVGLPIADRILNEAVYQNQRKIYSHHAKFLAEEMRRGSFGQGSQLAFCQIGDKLILVNGYHRMTAITLTGIPQEFQVLIQPVDSLDDVARDYHQYDFGVRKRTVSEVLGAMDFAKKNNLSKTIAKVLYDSALLIENGFVRVAYQHSQNYKSVDYRTSIARRYVEQAYSFEQAIKNSDPNVKKKLKNSGIMAVAIATFIYQPEKAMAFWKGLADRDGLSRNDPRQTFYNDLLVRNLAKDSIGQGEKAAALAWNAFYEGRKIAVIKVYAERPVKIFGTPWR